MIDNPLISINNHLNFYMHQFLCNSLYIQNLVQVALLSLLFTVTELFQDKFFIIEI